MNNNILEYHKYNLMFDVFSAPTESVALLDGTKLPTMNVTFDGMLDVKKCLSNNGGVYCWYNTLNKKIYIGSSINLWRRFKTYKQIFINSKTNRANDKLVNSIKAHGVKVYKFYILELFNGSTEDLRKKEQFYLDKYRPFAKDNRGYNFNINVGMNKPSLISEDSRERIKQRHIGENSESSKLTNVTVLDIKTKLSKGVTLKELASMYNVSTTVISNVKSGKTWGHIKASDDIENILKEMCYKNRKGKLTEDLVREIKLRLQNGERCYLLAKEYNLPYTTVHGLKIGHYYTHVKI
jgi:group I intron endonuclease